MKLADIEKFNKTSIFESISPGDVYFRTWEKEIHPVLCEVALSPDKIQQLFKSIETDAGRSILGKGVDAVKGTANKISDAWFNKFGGMLQSSGPVQAFDQKWEDIKSKIGAKNPELAAKLAKYGQFAKNNPNLHKFLLAIAGSAAAALGVAVAGGVGAGALAVGTGTGVAVGILNIADRLLQGQKASTSIGRGATTGAIAGLAAGAAAKISDMVKAGIRSDAIADLKGMKITRHIMSWNGQQFSAVTEEPLTSQLSRAFNALGSNPSSDAVNNFAKILAQANNPTYQQALSQTRETAAAVKAAAQSSINIVKYLTQIGTAATGGVASAATNQQPTESLSENQITELFGFTGNKIDSATLEKEWEKLGKPTDSDEILKILQKYKINQDIINKAFNKIGINMPPTPTATPPVNPPAGTAPTPTATPPANKKINFQAVVADIKRLNASQKNEIINLLKA